MSRKPLAGLPVNVPGGQRGPKRHERKAQFAAKPVILATPEQLPVSPRPETEERKSAFLSRTRAAGQTPYKHEESDQVGEEMQTPTQDDSIFGFDYGYHSNEVNPKVNRTLEIYEYGTESVDAGNSSDVTEMDASGEEERVIDTATSTPIVASGRKDKVVESPTQNFSPSMPAERATLTVESSISQSAETHPRSGPSESSSPVGGKSLAGADEGGDHDDVSEMKQFREDEDSMEDKRTIVLGQYQNVTESSSGLTETRKSPTSGKISPHTGPSFFKVGISTPQQEQGPKNTGRETSSDYGRAHVNVAGVRKHADKETISSSVGLPAESQRRGPLATPSNTNLQEQYQGDFIENGLLSVNKPLLGGRRHHMISRSDDMASVTSFTNSHLHRPDRPDRESIPRPDPVYGHKAPDHVVEEMPKASSFNESEQQQSAPVGVEREGKDSIFHLQPPINSSGMIWASEGIIKSTDLQNKRTLDHSMNYSMSTELNDLDDEFRGLNELMESFMLRTQDNYFYSRQKEQVLVQQQQQKVFVTKKKHSKKRTNSARKSIFGPPIRGVPYSSGISPDSSAIDDSLFRKSPTEEQFEYRQGGPQINQAIVSPVKMAREEAENDLDVTAVTTSTTTMSVADNSYLDDSTGGEAVIAFNSRKDLDDGALSLEEDMKEVTLSCAPLNFTTLVLTFRNQRKRPMTLKSSAILVRFDKLGNFWDVNKSSCNQSSLLGPSGSVFQVSPRVLKLEPGARANLYLTFSPNQEAQGIYSGALKIKSNGKSFVLLLRGEARQDGDDRALLEGPDMTDASVQADLDTYHPSPPRTTKLWGSFGRANASRNAEVEETFDIIRNKPRVLSNYPQSGPVVDFHAEEDSLGYGVNTHVENLSTRGKWLQKWVMKERGTRSEDFDLISVPDTINLDSDGHGMLVIESKSSLAVEVELSLPSDSVSMSDSKARIAPHGKFRVSLFTTLLSQYSEDSAHFVLSPTKSHVCFLTVTTIDDQRDYVIDIRREYKSPTKGSAVIKEDGNGALMVTPQKTFLWPSVTQSLGTVDRVSQTLQLETPLRNLPPSSRSVFFRTNVLRFRGALNVLTRERVDLCNTTDQQMNVRIEDPDLPFVLLHNEISIDAKSYVSVPIRFVPVSRREYSSTLHGSTLDGRHCFSVTLLGTPEKK